MRTFLLILLASPVLADCGVAEALLALRPNAEWIMEGRNDYQSLQWISTTQTKPTAQEVIAQIQACRSDETTRISQKQQARLDVRNTSLTQGQRLQALLILLDFDR